MAHFASEDEMLDAMGGAYSAYPGKAPRGMTKAKQRAFVAPNIYTWAECDCKGMPSPKRGGYFVHGSENCPIHRHVKGNVKTDSGDA